VGPRSVHVRRAAHVDLGGIAKGFAVDRAIEAMQEAGASSGLVNAGGDLRVFGREAWPLWIRLGGAEPRQLLLRDAALAGSDPGSAQPPAEHRGYYAPGSAPRSGPRAAAVMAPSAALADALTKVLVHAARGPKNALLSRYRAREIRPLG